MTTGVLLRDTVLTTLEQRRSAGALKSGRGARFGMLFLVEIDAELDLAGRGYAAIERVKLQHRTEGADAAFARAADPRRLAVCAAQGSEIGLRRLRAADPDRIGRGAE